eukprot:1456538-Rhodomonas_salina.1
MNTALSAPLLYAATLLLYDPMSTVLSPDLYYYAESGTEIGYAVTSTETQRDKSVRYALRYAPTRFVIMLLWYHHTSIIVLTYTIRDGGTEIGSHCTELASRGYGGTEIGYGGTDIGYGGTEVSEGTQETQ